MVQHFEYSYAVIYTPMHNEVIFLVHVYDISQKSFCSPVYGSNVQHLTVTVGNSGYWGVNVFSVQRHDSDEVFLSSQLAWQHC